MEVITYVWDNKCPNDYYYNHVQNDAEEKALGDLGGKFPDFGEVFDVVLDLRAVVHRSG